MGKKDKKKKKKKQKWYENNYDVDPCYDEVIARGDEIAKSIKEWFEVAESFGIFEHVSVDEWEEHKKQLLKHIKAIKDRDLSVYDEEVLERLRLSGRSVFLSDGEYPRDDE